MLLLLLAILPACEFDDEPPDYYVEALRPDLFFVVPLPYQASAATVSFETAKVEAPARAPAIEVVSWANDGGNIFDETLGNITLDTPREGKYVMSWSTAVVPPASTVFDKVGVALPALYRFVAYPAPLYGAQYCEISMLGPGVGYCADWIDAVLQMLVQCRDLLGKFISCHELGAGALRPAVAVIAISKDHPYAMSSPPIQYFMIPSFLLIYQARDGRWWCKALLPEDFSLARPFAGLEEREAYGPFATPEQAGQAAAAHIDVPLGAIRPGISQTAPESDMGRAEAALLTALRERANLR